MEQDDKSPHPIDIHVGSRVKIRRKSLGMSQEALADCLDLTFQQVQKYERGSNRVSASKLYEIAKALKVQVSYFFDGYQGAAADEGAFVPSSSEHQVHDFLTTAEGVELAQAFPRIKAGKHRRRVLDLVVALANDQ